MQTRSKDIDFKINEVKFNLTELESDAKFVRKIHAKQKVNNILVECESFEKYTKNGDQRSITDLTFWVDIKVFGNHKYRPAYNYELHSSMSSKYNQIYDTTHDIYPIKIGSSQYETLQRFLSFISKGFDPYIANLVNIVIQMNAGKQLTGVPQFILQVEEHASAIQHDQTDKGLSK